MIRRNERGLSFSSIDLQIIFADLFEVCKTEKEVEWVQEIIESCLEIAVQEKIDDLEDE